MGCYSRALYCGSLVYIFHLSSQSVDNWTTASGALWLGGNVEKDLLDSYTVVARGA